MKRFNQQKFNNFILDNNVVGFFEEAITLKSGRQSRWYVNWRKMSNDVHLMDRLTDFVIDYTKDLGLEPDCFYGVPEGATKVGVLVQFKWAKQSKDYGSGRFSLPMGRAKPKDHGAPEDKYFVGAPQGKTVVLEDVTTTGGSLLDTLDKLEELGIKVVAIFSLTNRMEVRDDGKSVKQTVEARGFPYYSLSSALELLPRAYEKLNPGQDIATAVEEEFKKYGVEKIKLK